MNESNDTDILVRISDNSGVELEPPDPASTTTPRAGASSCPGSRATRRPANRGHLARRRGTTAVSFGSGSTTAVPNDDAMYYGSISSNFGAYVGAERPDQRRRLECGRRRRAGRLRRLRLERLLRRRTCTRLGGQLEQRPATTPTGTAPRLRPVHRRHLGRRAAVRTSPVSAQIGGRAEHRGCTGRSPRAGRPGFDVYREIAGRWTKVEARLIPARSAAGPRTPIASSIGA